MRLSFSLFSLSCCLWESRKIRIQNHKSTHTHINSFYNSHYLLCIIFESFFFLHNILACRRFIFAFLLTCVHLSLSLARTISYRFPLPFRWAHQYYSSSISLNCGQMLCVVYTTLCGQIEPVKNDKIFCIEMKSDKVKEEERKKNIYFMPQSLTTGPINCRMNCNEWLRSTIDILLHVWVSKLSLVCVALGK